MPISPVLSTQYAVLSTQHSVPTLHLSLLGGFRATYSGRTLNEDAWKLRKASSLVKILALAPAHAMHREQVCDLLWPDLDFEAAHNNLRYALHVARRTLAAIAGDAPLLVLRRQTITLCPPDGPQTDVAAFAAAAAYARRSHDPRDYDTAIAGYTGDLLPDDRYEDWATVRRETLRGTFRALLHERAALHEAGGDRAGALVAFRRAVALDEADEEAHAGLIRLHARAGERAQAVAQYAALRAALRRELDATPSPETERLYADALAGATTATHRDDAPTASRRATDLPAPLTPFIGRQRESASVIGLLATTRLLTLTGAGGCGKTRLALAVARACADAATFPDGVRFVELAACAEPERVPRVVAAALGLREQPGRTHTEIIADGLRGQRLLLVLDNCEHLADACAELAAALLAACPDLRILATSRETLRVPGETIWRVPSLALPPAVTTTEGLAESEAVQLFVERVRARQPAFAVTEANAGAVAAVCRRLDGMPLALELAAARTGVLTVPQLAARLDDALRLLTDGGRTAPPRQRTLRATLDWSYALLEADERLLLQRLSVFVGGCTVEAAEAVCAGDDLPADDVLALLARLADKSLVVVGAERGEARYDLLETVRQYAHGQLASTGATDAMRRRHNAYFAARAEAAGLARYGATQPATIADIDADIDNLRASLIWCRENGDDWKGLRLAAALWPFWIVRGLFSEGREWLECFIKRTEDDPRDDPISTATRAMACTGAAYLANQQHDSARTAMYAALALALCHRSGDTRGTAYVQNLLGIAAHQSNDYTAAMAHYAESVALHREVGDTRGVAASLGNLGRTVRFLGDIPRAQAFFAESEALRREIGDTMGLAVVLGNQGHMAREQGEWERAVPLLAESLSLYEQLGDKRGIAIALNQLAQVAYDAGDTARARDYCARGLAIRRAIGDRWGIANSLCTLGDIAVDDAPLALTHYRESLVQYRDIHDALGMAECMERIARLLAARDAWEGAARLLGAADALREQIHAPILPVDRPSVAATAATVRAALGPAAWDAAHAAGSSLPLPQMIAEALRPA